MTASAWSTASGVAAADAAALGRGPADAGALGWLAVDGLAPPVDGDADAVQPTTSIAAVSVVRVRFRCTGVLLLGSLPQRVGWPHLRSAPSPAPCGPSTHGFACDHLLCDRIQQGNGAPRSDVVIRPGEPAVRLGQQLRRERGRGGDPGKPGLDPLEERCPGAADAAADH